MINRALMYFDEMDNIYQKNVAFIDLRKFNLPETNKAIEKYVDGPDHLLSYNAKRILEIDPSELW